MSYEQHQEALQNDLKKITAELKTLGIHNPENEHDWVATPSEDTGEADMNDVADSAEEWEEKTSTLALLETEWNNINRALEKIDNGTYGTCEVCEAPIEEDRLEAEPAARTCIAHLEDEATLDL
jgi:RNA polymerase-binding transcription factor DksA